MRLLYTSLIAISVGVLQYIDNPAIFHRAWAAVTTAGSETVSQKEVRIEGLKVLPRAEVERVLPYDRSVLWWYVNGTDIQSKVAESPWIDEATVESCPGGALRSWGCFVLAVKERTPRFLGLVDNERWIIDSEGAFIMPSGGPLFGLSPEAVSHLVVVEGLASRASSPDTVRSQLALASGSIGTLEREVGRSVGSLRFESRGDFSVVFDGLPFPVVFAGSPDASISLKEQGARLAALLTKLQNRLGDVAKIDLAFSRVGIVKFRAEEPPTKPASGGEKKGPPKA
jgi:hypothetical protein